MKTIGLIGGTSWHSTIDYYRIINETTGQRLGNDASAKLLLYSVNFEEIVQFTIREDWDSIAAIIGGAAQKLEKAGADCILLCANTMHNIAAKVQAGIDIPLLHVADIVSKAIVEKGAQTVLLLGTKYTMQGSFYKDRLQSYGIKTVIPDLTEIASVNSSIYDELGKGIILSATKKMYLDIINKYVGSGIDGIILGCTEIPLLIQQADSPVYLFDTTRLHAIAAVDFALG